MQQTFQYKSLTGIRAIAAILVFVYHAKKYWYTYLPSWLYSFLQECDIGVSVFFVLSGFLISYKYKNKAVQNSTSFLKYLYTRMCRILPMYWIILYSKYIVEGFPTWQKMLLQTSLLHAASDYHNLDGVSQAWSLHVELTFYLLAPFCFSLISKSYKWFFILAAAFFIFGLGIGYIIFLVNKNPNAILYPYTFILEASFWGRSAEFLAGVLLSNYVLLKMPSVKNSIKFTAISIIGLLAGIVLLCLLQPNAFKGGTSVIAGILLRNLIMPIPICLLLYSLMFEKNVIVSFLSSKLMVILGNASFIFYLVHIGVFNNLCNRYIGIHADRNFLFLWLFSILVYYFIDKPIYNFAKRLIKF